MVGFASLNAVLPATVASLLPVVPFPPSAAELSGLLFIGDGILQVKMP